jgi:hypothetical protein
VAVRTDVSVDFTVSPRIITIATPSTTITIQDLWDTLRTIEAEVCNLNYPALIFNTKSGGKQTLSAVKVVGITLTLNDAKLKFADRGGPSHINTSITDGNLVAVDTAELDIDPIEPAAFVNTIRELDVSAGLIREPGFVKNQAIQAFPVTMFNSTDHVTPQPGLTVSGFIKKNGGALVALTNAVTESGSGIYEVDITAAEMNADNITLRFTAAGADPATISLFTNA